jgi:hypothetical protein
MVSVTFSDKVAATWGIEHRPPNTYVPVRFILVRTGHPTIILAELSMDDELGQTVQKIEYLDPHMTLPQAALYAATGKAYLAAHRSDYPSFARMLCGPSS